MNTDRCAVTDLYKLIITPLLTTFSIAAYSVSLCHCCKAPSLVTSLLLLLLLARCQLVGDAPEGDGPCQEPDTKHHRPVAEEVPEALPQRLNPVVRLGLVLRTPDTYALWICCMGIWQV